jgi:hypothetical protein
MTTQSEPQSEPSARCLDLGINKAENMPYPEVFASALAKTVYSSRDWDAVVSGNKRPGVVYRRLSETEAKTVEFIEVDPYREKARTDSAKWEDFLKGRVFCDDSKASIMARAAADSFAGTLSEGGRSQLASPMSPGLALLQDTRGVTGKTGPYSVGSALERMYELGGPRLIEDGLKRTAASRWDAAVRRRLGSDRLLRALDDAAREVLVPDVVRRPRQAESEAPDDAPVLGEETPFAWFRTSWDHLTSPRWVDALPARRWSDWAATVLRSAIGFGTLWESEWLQEIARQACKPVDAEEVTFGGLLSQVQARVASSGLLDWKPADAKVSVRDVGAKIKESTTRYDCLKGRKSPVYKAFGPNGIPGEGVSEAFRRIRGNVGLRNEFRHALEVEAYTKSNLPYEAVNYMLQKGEESGRYADHYGFLGKVGQRWTVIEPATEWTAVMASLTMDEPGKSATLRDFSLSLNKLGLRPTNKELVRKLEIAGLARGSADADGAVVVRSAY